jgi:hypothetical protein
MRSWRLWPIGSCGSTTTARTGNIASRRMDASNAVTLTTLSPIAPRRASWRLARATTSLVDARARGSTPLESTSPREDSTRRCSRRNTSRRLRSRSVPSSPPSATLTMTLMTQHLPRVTRRLTGGLRIN